jgi:amino acid adenylation domain-containing protein
MSSERLAQLSAQKRALLLKLLKSKSDTHIRKLPRDAAHFPVSFGQHRIWFLDQMVPGSPFFNESTRLRMPFPMNAEVLERSLNEIVRRHEVLRTTFAIAGNEPVQTILPSLHLPLPIIDLRHLAQAEREGKSLRLASEEALKPFDLTKAPLLRTTLLWLGEADFLFLLTVHHIICDGWSGHVFAQELKTLYPAYLQGQGSPLPELSIQYADYAVWQRRLLQGEGLKKQLAYWKNQLADLPVLQLPTDHPRPAVQSFRGAHQTSKITGSLYTTLRELSQHEGVTMFMTTLAAFKILLLHYTRQGDIVVGVPVANRSRPELEPLIGFFVNVLVMRTDLSGDPTFREMLKRVRDVSLEAYSHQDIPFEKLVDELQPERETGRSPLFQVTFQVFNDFPSTWKATQQDSSELQIETGITKFDLRVDLWDSQEGLEVMFEYSTDLFDGASITRMIRHFQTLLEGLAVNPDQRVSELSLLSANERQKMLYEWNRTQQEFSRSTLVHQLFEARAELAPDATAVVCGGEQLSYHELNRRANQLAHYLRRGGVGPESLVAICMERSLEMIVGQLGVLKAGAAYVPLDPAYPEQRLAFMIDDAQAKVLLTKQGLRGRLDAARAEIISLDKEWEEIAGSDESNPSSKALPEHLAYVIYTSGSTGQPKGVQIQHCALMNLINWHQSVYCVTPADRATLLAGPGFDASVWELWPYLSAGASIHIPDQATVNDSSNLLEWLADEKITICFLPTPLAEAVLNKSLPANLRLQFLLTGGDKLQRRPRKPLSFRFLNHYGPTENAVVATYAPVNELRATETVPSIGRPISNVQAYVLDAQMQPVPVGVPGELCIGGESLARGYLGHPDLTAERFVPHPFSEKLGARLYKTGDLVKFLPDGNLEFLGRFDQQIKIRGFRIELGEIETTLQQHPAVRDAVAVVFEDTPGEKRLVTYVVPEPMEHASESDLNSAAVSKWQSIYDKVVYKEVMGEESSQQDPTFNITGWRSTYTGQMIPTEEMREQVEGTVERILGLRPQRVLEIGCGTGLLLFRIAPHCARYVGTDFSSLVLDYVKTQLRKVSLPHVQLIHATADDLRRVEAEMFDTVILNSVVQYFPGINYLLRLLEKAVQVVSPGGRIFLGDVRSLSLMEMLHTSLELHQAAPLLSTKELTQRIQKRMSQEKELLIAPTFFTALKEHLPQISHVQVQLKRGWHHNELTGYRYDVMLQVDDGEARRQPEHAWLKWEEQGLDLAALRELLKETLPDMLGITEVPSERLQSDIKAVELLSGAECPDTVEGLHQALAAHKESGVEPEALWALGDDLGYEVCIGWLSSGTNGRYDLFLKRRGAPQSDGLLDFSPKETSRHKPWSDYANDPLQTEFTEKLLPVLRVFLQKLLPNYMMPSSMVLLDSLPLTPNGKLDRRALPAPGHDRPEMAERFAPPQTGIETIVAGIWQEVLGVEKVGLYDNFFDLGGHSLLLVQLHAKLRKTFQTEVSIIDLFSLPTVSSLVKCLSKEVGESPLLKRIEERP